MRALRRALKRFVAVAASWVLGGRGRALSGDPGSILVLRIDERVGNVLLTTPLLSALRARFPAARIDVLVAASKASIVADADPIRFEKRDLFVRPWRFLSLVWGLRKRYDVAIDASHWHHFSVSSALLLGWTGSPVRIAHARGEATRFATHVVDAPDGVERETRTKLRLLGPLVDGEAVVAPMRTALGAGGDARTRMDAWIAENLPDQRIVGLAPGARKADHRIDPAVFAALARHATDRGAAPLVLWGPGEEPIAERVAKEGGAILAPPTDLDELAALMRNAAAVVTNDTGPMHLSVACEAPTIALFLRANPDRWGHADPPHAVIACDELDADRIVERATAALDAALGLTPPPVE